MKKMFIFIMVSSILLSMSLQTFAVSPDSRNHQRSEEISQRYRYINDCELSVEQNGSLINASAYISISSNAYSSKTVLVLEKYTGGSYNNAGTIENSGVVTSKYYNVSGTITASGDYPYRVKAVITVYNSRGVQIDSDTIYYSL